MDKKEEKQKEKSSEEEIKKECPCPDCECENCECEEGKECVCKNGKCKDYDCKNCPDCECEDKGGKDEFKEKLEECEHKYKRALADYQNLEKRVRDERGEWIRSANRDLLLRMLPVLDTLMLAQNHSTDQTLKVTIQQFLDVLKSEGVDSIKTEREEFNPHLMEVISTDTGDENKVLKEVRRGYKMGDRILRVAQVVVGKGTSN